MPWLVLGESLTGALINLAFKKDRLYMSKVIASFTRFIEAFFSNSEYGLSNYLALLGVLYGATSHAQLFAASEKGFNLFRLLDTCIDNVKFLKPLHEYSSNLFDSPEIRYCCGKERMSIFSPILFIDALGDLMCQIANSVLGNSSKPLLEFLVSKASEGAQEISETESLATADEVLPKQNGVYDNNLVDRTNALLVSASNISESTSTRSFKESVVQRLAENALKKIEVLDYGEVYIIYSSMSRLKLGYSAKSKFLLVFLCGVFNDIIDEQISKNTFQNSLGIHDALLDHHLGSSIIQLGSLLVFKDQTLGSSLTRAFTSLVADPKLSAVQCQVISKCVGLASRVLSQDTVVTTIYALSNLLFVDDDLHLQSRSRKHSSLRNELSASLNGSRHNDAISHRLKVLETI